METCCCCSLIGEPENGGMGGGERVGGVCSCVHNAATENASFHFIFNPSGQRPLWRRPFLRRRVQGAEPTGHSGASNVEGILMCDTSHTVVRSEVSVAASEAFRQTNKNREHNLFLFFACLFCVFFF